MSELAVFESMNANEYIEPESDGRTGPDMSVCKRSRGMVMFIGVGNTAALRDFPFRQGMQNI